MCVHTYNKGIPYFVICIVDLIGNDGANGNCVAASVITGAVTLIVILPVGVVLGCCGMWYMMRRRQGHTLECPEQKMEQIQEAIYDEPLETTIHLSDNQAYGLSK